MCPLDIVCLWFSKLNTEEQWRNQESARTLDSLARYPKSNVANQALRQMLFTQRDFAKVQMAVPHLRMLIAKMIIHECFENAEELCKRLEAGEGEEVQVRDLILRKERETNLARVELFQVLRYLPE